MHQCAILRRMQTSRVVATVSLACFLVTACTSYQPAAKARETLDRFKHAK